MTENNNYALLDNITGLSKYFQQMLRLYFHFWVTGLFSEDCSRWELVPQRPPSGKTSGDCCDRIFYRLDALPVAQPTVCVKALKVYICQVSFTHNYIG